MKYAETEARIPLRMHRSVERSIAAQARIPVGMHRSVERNTVANTRIPLGMRPYEERCSVHEERFMATVIAGLTRNPLITLLNYKFTIN